ncbi:GerMN domain-containing protein [Ammoniphilus sp. CFH 90114]|uniref:GerMN domain-containing protein n=1 Tax=Ammoniphilus sp. CFH 90114 TaxID=2493665 RepID=UPI00100EB908|nr:GerMN domain-containing protein [Ammoniphilus sp. CFH 90114]RXT14669.1 spore gernimation protein [Ammoniphilus sp. CFH 90114]
MSRKWLVSLSLTTTAILLSGCGLFGPEQTVGPQPIDPPHMSQTGPVGDSKEVTLNLNPEQGQASDTTAEAAQMIAMPVYMMDPDGYVVPISLQLPKAEGAAKQVLSHMVKGGPVELMKPEGFTPLIPEGTKILGMTIKDGVATIDFSPEFKNYEAKNEQKLIDAITFALTSFDTIKEVNIWINGYPQDVMPVNGTPISSLTRENGINVELANNVQVGNTTPITLYFQGETADNAPYYVPVTRLIPRTDNKAMATLEQLIQGPKDGTNLFSSILPTTKVLDVKMENGVAVVNFDDKLLSYNDGKANPMAMESILLSLTENAEVGAVQFMVNGQMNVMAGEKDYSNPVSRPIELNPRKW